MTEHIYTADGLEHEILNDEWDWRLEGPRAQPELVKHIQDIGATLWLTSGPDCVWIDLDREQRQAVADALNEIERKREAEGTSNG